MTRAEMIAEIEEMLELDAGTLSGDTALEPLDEWDSLAVISYIALVDEKFDETLDGAALADAATVEDLLALVASHLD